MREGDGALFNTEAVFAAGQELVEMVKRRAQASPRHSCVACLHRENSEPVLEMLMAVTPAGTRPPHSHGDRAEMHLVLEGELTALFFDRNGALTRRIDMGPPGSGKPFCLRTGPGQWHMIVFQSAVVVYYEIMAGPYVKGATLAWAPWAPAPDDGAALAAFVERWMGQRVCPSECC